MAPTSASNPKSGRGLNLPDFEKACLVETHGDLHRQSPATDSRSTQARSHANLLLSAPKQQLCAKIYLAPAPARTLPLPRRVLDRSTTIADRSTPQILLLEVFNNARRLQLSAPPTN
ncbi:hypothetical protein [Oscillatoria nigro-viridis]|uniref:hypothetical protein n=1 Tax=Phormidium nigroviride TaxID=482564 RepID=UPI0002DB9F93|nr:hypothetical protein [Oscillatoria nigro-viridis]